MTHPGGAPTKYKKEYGAMIEKMGDDGLSVVQMAVGLDIVTDSLYEWAKVNPEFSVSFRKAKQNSQNWWESRAQESLSSKEFNAGLWGKIASCRFPKDYREKSEHKEERIIYDMSAVSPEERAIIRKELLEEY